MKSYVYMARKVKFSELEDFLNETSEHGFFLVQLFPVEMTISEEKQTMEAEIFNVIMARKAIQEPLNIA